MNMKEETYTGFEVGPIRPPSEAGSLMLRITRNCPWNRCKFCGLYKGEKFSIRPVDHIKKDITRLKEYIDDIRHEMTPQMAVSKTLMDKLREEDGQDQTAFHAALNWYRGGMQSVFLQDANTLIVKPDDLVETLSFLRQTFPEIQRITSYARSHTIARISDADMVRLAKEGLNRIHIGMESASDEVLKFVKKGVDKATHIKAGQRVKRAGIELSEYFMPGLGGQEFSTSNALETADALNQINPDFIRIRTLAVTDFSDLAKDVRDGLFTTLNDVQAAEELLMMLDHLEGIASAVKSDHILNLFQEVDGVLPDDKQKITEPIRRFLALLPEDQMRFMVGRRTGILTSLADMDNPGMTARLDKTIQQFGITPENVNEFTSTIMKRFI
ncbi:MAG: radical SAM protein [Desulfobacterales bacterium]|nr:radical SAM protein [Desulfobacterales bacterium]